MTLECIRVWKALSLDDIKKHLVVVGDTTGDCSQCRALGINPWNTKECPECHTVFKYIASRRIATHTAERFQLARRVQQNRPDLELIDYEDYQKVTGSQRARDFFST